MSSMNLGPLYLLSFTLLLHGVIGVDPLLSICFNSLNFTSGSPYSSNLNTVLNQLNIKVPPTGFGLSSVGYSQDTVNGLALCRGETSRADCKSCVNTASAEIQQRCPNDKGAIIWYDHCLLKYSNVNFFGTIDYQNKFFLFNVQTVNDTESFNQKTKKFLSKLSDKASGSSKLFATGKTSLGKLEKTTNVTSQKLYGLVQCTRDLSNSQCKKCLDDVISELPSCCDGKRGGRVVGGSCNFRYELYPFVKS
ncbi:hypothetical protein IFM89_000610 [Coptis chinensis]|uniref:Gnk2-homologous domain-containing protein n=1 Tax=Coptis chinensis TaxID=261450 RepID=A0A835LK75_9MAGN|nr:hypothetical protein IFM89_000610 [Coptis chinensis]